MVLNPDAQHKAQDEIDGLLGGTRLPSMEDEGMLPYVGALVKEVLRWHPVVNLAIPHKVMEDDVYEGYLIPGGSMVIGNSWAILHDPNVFPDPESFRPEHFLTREQGGTLPAELADKFPDAVFGFGRRICPGRFMAQASVWTAVANVLAAFSIRHAKDEEGRVILVQEKYNSGIVSYPAPFECEVKPRSEKVRELVTATAG